MGYYISNFKNNEDVADSFERGYTGGDFDPQTSPLLRELQESTVHVAWYGDGSYCGAAFVLFSRDGKLFRVDGSHCSCTGLEGQWEPIETDWSTLFVEFTLGSEFKAAEYAGWVEVEQAVLRVIRSHAPTLIVASNAAQ